MCVSACACVRRDWECGGRDRVVWECVWRRACVWRDRGESVKGEMGVCVRVKRLGSGCEGRDGVWVC